MKIKVPAGHHYSGHTEIYADYAHTKKYAMMLAGDDLRIVHVSLREACDHAKKTANSNASALRIRRAGSSASNIRK